MYPLELSKHQIPTFRHFRSEHQIQYNKMDITFYISSLLKLFTITVKIIFKVSQKNPFVLKLWKDPDGLARFKELSR